MSTLLVLRRQHDVGCACATSAARLLDNSGSFAIVFANPRSAAFSVVDCEKYFGMNQHILFMNCTDIGTKARYSSSALCILRHGVTTECSGNCYSNRRGRFMTRNSLRLRGNTRGYISSSRRVLRRQVFCGGMFIRRRVSAETSVRSISIK